MILLSPTSRTDMERNHARAADAKNRRKAAARTTPQKQFNVETVLDLGNVAFFHFRGRAYGVPPLPWRAGQRLMAAWLDASQYADRPLTKTTAPLYFAALAELPKLLWRHCFPAKKSLRILRALRLARNPFQDATETELVEHAAFFLSRRMRSGDSAPQVQLASRNEEMH